MKMSQFSQYTWDSLISVFVVHCLDSIIIPILAKSKISILWLVSEAEQTGLSLIWSQNPEGRFSHDMTHVILQVFQCPGSNQIVTL